MSIGLPIRRSRSTAWAPGVTQRLALATTQRAVAFEYVPNCSRIRGCPDRDPLQHRLLHKQARDIGEPVGHAAVSCGQFACRGGCHVAGETDRAGPGAARHPAAEESQLHLLRDARQGHSAARQYDVVVTIFRSNVPVRFDLFFTPWNLAALDLFGAMLAFASSGRTCLVLGRSENFEKFRIIHQTIGRAVYLAYVLESGHGR
jgi:hypothetical protein